MRILIVRLSAMGDIIHSLPLAENARRAGVEVGWLVESSYETLLAGNPAVTRLFVASTKRWRRHPLAARSLREVRELAAALRQFDPDFAIDAQGLWKSALLAGLVKAPRVGLAARDRREASSAALIDRPVRLTEQAVHVVDQNLLLLDPVGIKVEVRAPEARYLLARESPDADAFLARQARPFAIYHPGAAKAEKTWGEESFAALARRLEKTRGLHAVISWGPGDEPRRDRLAALLPKARAVPPVDLPSLARIIDASSIFVAGDTGPVHLADALGKPALALFGQRSGRRNLPERNKPYRGCAIRVAGAGAVDDVAAEIARILDSNRPRWQGGGNERGGPGVTVGH
jgi:lipopolysaccharide heptosyltransferase I